MSGDVDEASKRVVTELLKQMDGMESNQAAPPTTTANTTAAPNATSSSSSSSASSLAAVLSGQQQRHNDTKDADGNNAAATSAASDDASRQNQSPPPASSGRVLLLFSTNFPQALPPPFLRRLEKRIYVPLPTCEEKIAYFKQCMGSLSSSPSPSPSPSSSSSSAAAHNIPGAGVPYSVDVLAWLFDGRADAERLEKERQAGGKAAKGSSSSSSSSRPPTGLYSLSDVKGIAREAAMRPVRRLIAKYGGVECVRDGVEKAGGVGNVPKGLALEDLGVVTDEDVVGAWMDVRGSVSLGDVRRSEAFRAEFGSN